MNFRSTHLCYVCWVRLFQVQCTWRCRRLKSHLSHRKLICGIILASSLCFKWTFIYLSGKHSVMLTRQRCMGETQFTFWFGLLIFLNFMEEDVLKFWTYSSSHNKQTKCEKTRALNYCDAASPDVNCRCRSREHSSMSELDLCPWDEVSATQSQRTQC